MESSPAVVAATFCATLVDEWARAGVRHAVVCPGSRSTPLALALHRDDRIRLTVHHDERSGAFAALGAGLALGVPAVVLTTSGTAATHLHAAVVEADHACVPLLAVTADRPPELHDVGAPQTIRQVGLYGASVRWSHAPGVPDAAAAPRWRALAARSVAEASGDGTGGRPGPVHLDLAFREPLVGEPTELPPGRPDGAPWVRRAAGSRTLVDGELGEILGDARRGVVIAGTEPGGRSHAASAATAAARVAARLGWPLLLDARVRGRAAAAGPEGPTVVGAADALVRVPALAEELRPDVALHLGDAPASRLVGEWLAGSGATHVRAESARWHDPHGQVARRLPVDAQGLADALDRAGAAPASAPDGWTGRWAHLDALAQAAFDEVLAETGAPTEPGTARSVLAAMADGEALVVSSSMPIRDLEWFGRPRAGVDVLANRGTNGIDGVVSTALGVAQASGAPTACLIGDVALLHDSSALVASAGRDVSLTIVVVDNDGGGIFSFLPQASSLDATSFEALFGTPHGTDLALLAAAHGLTTVAPATAAEVGPAVRASLDLGGVRVVRVRTDRHANVALHRRLHAAVAAAVA